MRSLKIGLLLAILLAGAPARARRLVYTIRPGDTLSGLAARFHVKVEAIRSWNSKYFEKHGVLKVGRRLALRVDAATAREFRREHPPLRRRTLRYRVLPGDTLWHIARRFKVSTAQLQAWNPKVDPKELRPGATLVIRSAAVQRGRRRRCERVRPGDNLTRISRRTGVDVGALRRFNNLRRGALLKVGRLLCFHQGLPEEESRAVGKPQAGRLVAGERLRDGPGYHVKQRQVAYGTNELVTLLYRCLGRVHRRFKRRGRSTLVVGDLSRKAGGALGGHVSHRNGTDVDLGYYYENSARAPQNRFITRLDKIDLRRTWTLLHCLIDSGEVQYVFMDKKIQRALYRHARRGKLYPRADLDRVFEHGPSGRRPGAAIIRHVDNHADHMHVRVFCPQKDVARAKDKPGRCVPSPGRRRPLGD